MKSNLNLYISVGFWITRFDVRTLFIVFRFIVFKSLHSHCRLFFVYLFLKNN